MSIRNILTTVLQELLGSPESIANLRRDHTAVKLVDELYKSVHYQEISVASQSRFTDSLVLPTEDLNQRDLVIFYQRWGLHLAIAEGLAKTGIQPESLLDESITSFKFSGIKEVRQNELVQTIQMFKYIFGLESVRKIAIPTDKDYEKFNLEVLEDKWNLEKKTNQFLQTIGYPWTESLSNVSLVMKGNYRPRNIMALTDEEIESRKTWAKIAIRLKLLRLYLYTIEKANS